MVDFKRSCINSISRVINTLPNCIMYSPLMYIFLLFRPPPFTSRYCLLDYCNVIKRNLIFYLKVVFDISFSVTESLPMFLILLFIFKWAVNSQWQIITSHIKIVLKSLLWIGLSELNLKSICWIKCLEFQSLLEISKFLLKKGGWHMLIPCFFF